MNLLSKIAKRLAQFAIASSQSIIKVILSDKFTSEATKRAEILKKLSDLPGVEVRIYSRNEFQHRKNYIFRTTEEIRVIVGSVNITSGGLYKNLEIATLTIHDKEDPEAFKIISEFESMWNNSKSSKEFMELEAMDDRKSMFYSGQNVKILSTGKTGTVNQVIKGSRGYSYKVTVEGRASTYAERFLEAIIDLEDNIIAEFLEGHIGGDSEFKLFQTWFRLSNPLENNLYSYLGSKTIFNPYQFKPLLRFLSSNSDERLFIADEVGVGKTIETGIIITELFARDRFDNRTPILVVCPNSLGHKWVKEMKERFNLNFYFHNGQSLEYMLQATLQEGIIPLNYNFSVVGLQLLRYKDYLELLQQLDARRQRPVFAMVIVDEAHHMRNPETDSNETGNILSNLTEMMIMLSATPLNLRNEDLYHQMHILNPIAFPDKITFETFQDPVIKLNKIRRLLSKNTKESKKDIIIQLEELGNGPFGKLIISYPSIQILKQRLQDDSLFSIQEVIQYEHLLVSLSPLYSSFTRTRKREAFEHLVYREVWEVPISLSEREMRFHNDFLEAIKDQYLFKGGDRQALAFILNMHRRMVSSCLPAIREYLKWYLNENAMYILDEKVDPDEVEDDSQLSSMSISPALKNEFKRLLNESTELESIDNKYIQFKKVLEKVISNPETEQVMVFSFFIKTLEYLKRRLENDGFSVGIIHGKIPIEDTKDQPNREDIMDAFKRGEYRILLSSEVGGEGLDFQCCKAIINYDLPYNPMKIEQRIGRIDRFGQTANKIIIANLFIENTIDEEIYDRLYRRIHLIEEGIGDLEPILGKKLFDIQNAIITGKLNEEQMEELSKRLEEAIESAKIEKEEFEKYRAELLSDDYLTEPINNISKGNFVSPHDAIQLTEQTFSYWQGCTFKKTADSCGEIILSEEIIAKLEYFLCRPNNERGYGQLKALLEPKTVVKVVFDGSITHKYPDHLFISPTGFWTKFLIYFLQLEKKIMRIFKFRIKGSEINLPFGEYLIFLFQIKFEGLRTEIEFLAIPINLNNKEIPQIDFENLIRYLADKTSYPIDSLPENLEMNSFLDIVREYLDTIIEEKRLKASKDNVYKIETRITAISKSCEIKIRNFKEQINNHIERRKAKNSKPDDRYIRLTNSRIESEKTRTENKVKQLRESKEITLDYNLEGILYLKVDGKLNNKQ